MPSTENLQSAIAWCAPYLAFQPLAIGGPEPALTIGNVILQTMLGPPFCWRFNRATAAPFTCLTDGTQDYSVAISDFGFIEKAWLQDPASGPYRELVYKSPLARTSEKDRPLHICDQGDDNAGNITFRLMPAPDQAYPVSVQYQRKAALMLSLASTWAPIPDEFGYIYKWGFLALAAMLRNDSRFPIFSDKFVSHLLGAQAGLDEMQRNIFLGNWLEVTRAALRSDLMTKAAATARTR